MKRFIFRSGIRKITIKDYTLDDAKLALTSVIPDAWSDLTWNWKIEVLS